MNKNEEAKRNFNFLCNIFKLFDFRSSSDKSLHFF